MPDSLHNNPPKPAEQFRAEIDSLSERIEAFPDITDDNEGEANDLIRLAGNLAKEIDAKRAELKKPHLDAGRDIDGTFKPLESEAKDTAKPLKTKLSDHLREKERAAQAAAVEAARIAEEERVKAEAEAKLVMPADEAEVMADAERADVLAAAAAAQAKNASTAKGSHGLRASGLRTKKEVIVSDPIALVRHYHKHEAIIAACLSLAKQHVRSGQSEIPGIIIKETREL